MLSNPALLIAISALGAAERTFGGRLTHDEQMAYIADVARMTDQAMRQEASRRSNSFFGYVRFWGRAALPPVEFANTQAPIAERLPHGG